MSPKLGQSKTDSVREDRNYIGVEIDLETGDVTEESVFADHGEARKWAADMITHWGAGPHVTYGYMDVAVFDSLED